MHGGGFAVHRNPWRPALDAAKTLPPSSPLFPPESDPFMSQQHRKYVKRARRKAYLRRKHDLAKAGSSKAKK